MATLHITDSTPPKFQTANLFLDVYFPILEIAAYPHCKELEGLKRKDSECLEIDTIEFQSVKLLPSLDKDDEAYEKPSTLCDIRAPFYREGSSIGTMYCKKKNRSYALVAPMDCYMVASINKDKIHRKLTNRSAIAIVVPKITDAIKQFKKNEFFDESMRNSKIVDEFLEAVFVSLYFDLFPKNIRTTSVLGAKREITYSITIYGTQRNASQIAYELFHKNEILHKPIFANMLVIPMLDRFAISLSHTLEKDYKENLKISVDYTVNTLSIFRANLIDDWRISLFMLRHGILRKALFIISVVSLYYLKYPLALMLIAFVMTKKTNNVSTKLYMAQRTDGIELILLRLKSLRNLIHSGDYDVQPIIQTITSGSIIDNPIVQSKITSVLKVGNCGENKSLDLGVYLKSQETYYLPDYFIGGKWWLKKQYDS